MMNIYTVVYLMSNVLIMLGIERFMGAFFEKRRTPLLVIIFSYLVYLASTSFVFLLIGIPIVSVFINIIALFLISLNYESAMIKRGVSTISVYFFHAAIEIPVFLLTGIPPDTMLANTEYREIPGFIIMGMLVYLVGSLFRNFRNVKKNTTALPLYWVSAIFIPTLSLFVSIVIAFSFDLPQIVMLLAIVSIFAINLLAFFMHDYIAKSYEEKMKSMLITQEKEYYLSQCQLMQESVNKMKSFRHDIKIHLAAMKGFSTKNKANDVSGYLDHLISDIEESEIYSDTGNLAFDSIINYKLRSIQSSNIKLELEMNLPPILSIEIIDVVTILGNLLANSLDALEKVNEKWLKLTIDFSKGVLFIKVENSFDGKIKLTNEKNIASVKLSDEHGYGLKNIERTADKYNGYMKVDHDKNIFSVGVLLCLE